VVVVVVVADAIDVVVDVVFTVVEKVTPPIL